MPLRDDDGGATVELALVLPVVAVLLGIATSGAAAATAAVRVADAASVVARQQARGDGDAVGGTLAALVPGARAEATDVGDLVCVTVRHDVRLVGLGGTVPLSSRSCAPRAGR